MTIEYFHINSTEQGYPRRFMPLQDGRRLVASFVGVKGYTPIIDTTLEHPKWTGQPPEVLLDEYKRYLVSMMAGETFIQEDFRRVGMFVLDENENFALSIPPHFCFTREKGEPLKARVPEVTDQIEAFIKQQPNYASMFQLQPAGTKGDFEEKMKDSFKPESFEGNQGIVDLTNIEELLCVDFPLYMQPEWEELRQRSIFDPEFLGKLMERVRQWSSYRAHDVMIIRWRRETTGGADA